METVSGTTTENVVDNAECCNASVTAGDNLSAACSTEPDSAYSYDPTADVCTMSMSVLGVTSTTELHNSFCCADGIQEACGDLLTPNSSFHFNECDDDGTGILDTAQVQHCFDMNCDRYCRADSAPTNRRLQAATDPSGSDIDYTNWCMCINWDYTVVIDMFDTEAPMDSGLSRAEFGNMFDPETDFFLIDWPSKAQIYFDECNNDGDDFLDLQEIEYCYDLNCDRECTADGT